jgi:5-methylcytosine-specific restriction endonuclease McrA
MICAVCGAEFVAAWKRKQTCSEACAHRLAAKKGWDTRGRKNGPLREQVCKHCGKPFMPRGTDRMTYCGRECGFAGMQRTRQGQRGERAPLMTCKECGKVFNQPITPNGFVRRVRYYCKQCRGEGQRERCLTARETFCCRECAQRWGKRVCAPHREELARAALARHSYRRRICLAKAPCEFFTNREIFERDGWRCQICGKKVNKNLRGRHPMAASLDHIVPVSKGGKHVRSNVRLAHWICNLRKGNRVANDQLLLIG